MSVPTDILYECADSDVMRIQTNAILGPLVFSN